MLPTVEFSDPSVAKLDNVEYWEVVYNDGTKEGSATKGQTGEIDINKISRVNFTYDSPLFGGEFLTGWYTETYTGGVVTKIIKPANCDSITLHGTYSNTYYFSVKVVKELPSTPQESTAYLVDTPALELWINFRGEWILADKGNLYAENYLFPYIKTDFKSWIKFTFNDTNAKFLNPTNMVISYAHSNMDESPEISKHRTTDVKDEVLANSTAPVEVVNGFKVFEHFFQINGSNFCISRRDYADRNKSGINKILIDNLPEFQALAMTKSFQKFFIGSYRNS